MSPGVKFSVLYMLENVRKTTSRTERERQVYWIYKKNDFNYHFTL